MTALEKYLAKVKADALKANKTEAEADAIVAEAKTAAEAVLAHPLAAGLTQELKEFVSERETWKREKADLAPLAALGKEFQDKGKTDLEKLQVRLAELEPASAAAATLRTKIEGIVAKRLEGLPEKLRPLVPKEPVDALDWFDTAEAAGILKPPPPPDSGGAGQRGGLGGGAGLTVAELVGDGSPASLASFQANMTAIREGKKSITTT